MQQRCNFAHELALVANWSSLLQPCTFRNSFDKNKQHVRCFAHVMNIAVQELLRKNDVHAEAADDIEESAQDEGFDVIYSGEQVDDAPAASAKTSNDILIKLRKGVNKIRYGTSLKCR